MRKFLNLFSVLLAAIALLSLVVGGIGINNMMLVSVSNALKEFGLRKALRCDRSHGADAGPGRVADPLRDRGRDPAWRWALAPTGS